MVVPAIAWALGANALVYIALPRMPLYQVSAFRIAGIWPTVPSLFSGINVNAKMQAGLSVQNANFIGADVHGVAMDMFYEDWYGELRHIGNLQDKASIICDVADLVHDEITFQLKCPTSASPLLSVNARDTTQSEGDLVNMYLRNVTPGTQFQMIKDAVQAGGNIEIITSGVLHVKQSTLGLPLSAGLVCSNSFNTMTLPWVVTGHDCVVEDVLPGWSNIEEHTQRLREKTLMKHRETGKVLNIKKKDTNGNGVQGMEVDGMEIEWHL